VVDVTGVIDTTRRDKYCDENGVGTGDKTFTGYIYGVEPEHNESIDDFFNITGDGYWKIIANDTGSEVGAGTVVEIYDNDDNLIDTYVLLYRRF
jgi:hypothetical protein